MFINKLCIGLLLCVASLASAGEVQLRGYYQAKGPLVRIGDVVDFVQIDDAQRAQVERLPLFPAPAAGLSRSVTAQDVRETLSLYGISLPKIAIRGECRVEGCSEAESAKAEAIVASHQIAEAGAVDPKSATEQLSEQIVAYLQTKERIRTQWQVKPLLTSAQVTAIAAMQRPEISGGQAPWIGRQVFNVRDLSASSKKATTFKADVERVAQALVAKRSLAAGTVLGGDDVELAEVNPQALSTSAITDPADALGKEVKQALQAGQLLMTQSLQRPLVVKRNELITVYSLAAGIQVKVTAKALADGALGDVVLLEATETKKRFQGRITAPQEAMVFVDTPIVAGEASSAVAEKPLKASQR
jgi:flagella basal body P-ring formation protein FlgA